MNEQELIAAALPISIKLLKNFEGCKLTAYRDIAGILTIGYGETKNVKEGMKWAQEKADSELVARAKEFMQAVLKASPSLLKHSPEKLAACTSLAYNIGVSAFKGSSVAKAIANEDMLVAAEAFKLWNKAAGQIVQGLVNRRKIESDLFRSVRA
jgi:lysozyme